MALPHPLGSVLDNCASQQSSPKTPLDSVPIDITEALKAMGEAGGGGSVVV